jgi:hypothetical protein
MIVEPVWRKRSPAGLLLGADDLGVAGAPLSVSVPTFRPMTTQATPRQQLPLGLHTFSALSAHTCSSASCNGNGSRVCGRARGVAILAAVATE